ncbi:MAG TPA: DUF2059 domain-containing protein [Bradyrhizobium sp.]|nr:DUF2059 domain-containing protein [Bradyrhizobium sp.]
MKGFSGILSAVGLAAVLALSGAPAMAQAPKQGAAPAPAAKPAKPPSPAALSAAREFLMMKNVGAMFAGAVPGVVDQTRNALTQQNLNYQKDLSEVAVIVAKNFAGRENEIGEGMAQIYANEFSEQELKDIVTFYKTPLGQKLLSTEPRAIQMSMGWMNQWAQEFGVKVNEAFKEEMKKRNKPI